VWLGFSAAHDVFNVHSADGQRVGDQIPMASPGHRFGAHDRRLLAGRNGEQAFDAVREIGRAHIIRISPETQVSPCGIRRVRMCAAQPAESRKVLVRDSMRGKRAGQRITIEPWVRPRPGHCPDVGQALDRPRLENCDKVLQCAR